MAEIAKALKVTESAIYQQIKKLELATPPTAAAKDGEAMAPGDLVAFLREIGAKAAVVGAGQYEIDGKKADAIALLEHANAWRRRNKQPAFTLKR